MCSARCPVVCFVEDDRLVKVVPDLEHPMGGTFCVKGASASEFVYDKARLNYPVKRTNPKTAGDPGWTRITWDEALDTVSTKLLEIRDKYGPEAVVFYRPAPGGSPAGDYQPWLWRLANAFGTPNFGKTTHICNWHKDQGSKYTYGVGIPEGDYEHSGCILVWGTNPHNTHIRHAAEIQKAVSRGAKLIVVDPRRIPLSSKATHHLLLRPGTDLALCLGLINETIRRDLYDKQFVSKWTNAPFLVRRDTGRLLTEEDLKQGGSRKKYVVWDSTAGRPSIYDPEQVGYESDAVNPLLDGDISVPLINGRTMPCATVLTRLKEHAFEFTLERVSEITSVPAEEISDAVETMASNRPLSYYTWNGIEQHTDAMQTNRAICILYSLIGDFDRKGGNVVYPDLPVNPIIGFDLLPGEAMEKRLGGEKRPLGPSGTVLRGEGAIQAYEMYSAILTGKPYPVKALLCFGGNPIISNGDAGLGAEALKKIDFYAHIDLYENPTSRFADIVLPAASSWESEFLGRFEWKDKGHIQVRRSVVKPIGERRGDLEVMFELAVRLGLGERYFGGDVEAAFNYMIAPLGKTIQEVRDLPNGFHIPLPTGYLSYRDVDSETGRPHGFKTPTRLIEIYSTLFAEHGYDPLPKYRHPPEWNVDRREYPLLLTQYKPVQFIHGSYRSVPSLRKQFPEPTVEIHPSTAKSLGLSEGEWVAVETPKGAVRAKLRLDDGVHPEVAAGQEGWWQGCEPLKIEGYDPFKEQGCNLNLVISNSLIDDISGSVPHRGVPCKLRPL